MDHTGVNLSCIGRSFAIDIDDIAISYHDMRTIVDITQKQVEQLAEICSREKISRAEAIRRAIDCLVSHERSARRNLSGHPAVGVWRNDPRDSLTLVRKMRQEWLV